MRLAQLASLPNALLAPVVGPAARWATRQESCVDSAPSQAVPQPAKSLSVPAEPSRQVLAQDKVGVVQEAEQSGLWVQCPEVVQKRL